MVKICKAFEMKDARAAREHMDYEIIKDYGDYAYGHYLHTWDDGKRLLARCKNCGGYILIQSSEFHGAYDDDDYYVDFFPVESPEQADELNRLYSGFEIESSFPSRYLMMTNLQLHWSKQEA
jgi:hypothetical protein